MNEKIIIALLIALVMVVLILIFVVLKLFQQKNQETLIENNRILNENMILFQTSLLNALHQDMNTFNETTTQHLSMLEKNVNEQMMHNLKNTNEAYASVLKEVGKIDETQKHLKELSSDIHSLHTIFNDKKTRGIYGEIELYTLLEKSFGDDPSFFSKQYRLSNGFVVDAVVFGNDAMGMVAIDSKFPLENYNRLHDVSLTSSQKKVYLNEFKQNVKKHIMDIAEKYIIAQETSEYAYMFIPSESIFSYINAYLPELVEFSFEKKVYLASPSTLMAYITAMKAIHLGIKKNERIREIQQELNQLSLEFDRFIKRYEIVSKDYEKTANDMRDVLVSARKITRRFEKIDQVELMDE